MKAFISALLFGPLMAHAVEQDFSKVSLVECSYEQSETRPFHYELKNAYARNISRYDTRHGAKLDDWASGSFGVCNLLKVNPNPAGFQIMVNSVYHSGSGTIHPWSCQGSHNNYDVKVSRWMHPGDRFFVRMVSPDTVQGAPSKAYNAYAFEFIGIDLPDLTPEKAREHCRALTPLY